MSSEPVVGRCNCDKCKSEQLPMPRSGHNWKAAAKVFRDEWKLEVWHHARSTRRRIHAEMRVAELTEENQKLKQEINRLRPAPDPYDYPGAVAPSP